AEQAPEGQQRQYHQPHGDDVAPQLRAELQVAPAEAGARGGLLRAPAARCAPHRAAGGSGLALAPRLAAAPGRRLPGLRRRLHRSCPRAIGLHHLSNTATFLAQPEKPNRTLITESAIHVVTCRMYVRKWGGRLAKGGRSMRRSTAR